MLKVLLLFFISFPLLANICSINFFTYSYYNDDYTPHVKDLIKNTDCPSSILNNIDKLITNADNTFYSHHLENIFLDQYKQQIKITPTVFKISPLTKLITKKQLNSSTRVGSLKLNFSKIINLNSNQTMTISSFAKDKFSQQTLKISTYQNQKLIKTAWATLHLLHKTKLLITKYQISAYTTLNNVQSVENWVTNPNDYFTDIDHIHFYQTVRPIAQNSPIRINDITPKILVKAGIPTKVILLNKAIKLTTTALPYQSGKFGDSITLRNIKSGKKIQATITNENEVTISL